jgi:hypothetical protein
LQAEINSSANSRAAAVLPMAAGSNDCEQSARRSAQETSAVSPATSSLFSRRIAKRKLLRRISPIVTPVSAVCRHSAATIFFSLQNFADF